MIYARFAWRIYECFLTPRVNSTVPQPLSGKGWRAVAARSRNRRSSRIAYQKPARIATFMRQYASSYRTAQYDAFLQQGFVANSARNASLGNSGHTRDTNTGKQPHTSLADQLIPGIVVVQSGAYRRPVPSVCLWRACVFGALASHSLSKAVLTRATLESSLSSAIGAGIWNHGWRKSSQPGSTWSRS